MKEWITIAEAALLVGRDKRQMYRWIENGLLASRVGSDGVTEVLSKAVLRVESVVKRGRPKGSASKNGRKHHE